MFFCFKQKTAYEMRISDWSSDVCSSDLDYPLWWWPCSVLLYLLIHDTWFYWTHRWMHRPALFRRCHAVHHQSRPPTAWTAMSFHPWESLVGAIVIPLRSEEHTSELQSLMRISYAAFCLKKKKYKPTKDNP